MDPALRLYGTIDKTAVVIDIGTRWIKCGLASEGSPRKIFTHEPLEQLIFQCHQQQHVTQWEWDKMASELVRKLYLEQLLTKPKERNVLVMLYHDAVQGLRVAIAKAILKQFSAPSLCLTSTSGLALYPSGSSTGIVVDIGYLETRIICIYEGLAIQASAQVIPIGAYSAMVVMSKGIEEFEYGSNPDRNAIDEPIAFESRLANCNTGADNSESDLNTVLKVLFNEECGIHIAVQQSVLSCTSIIRTAVVQNVVVTGGLSMCGNDAISDRLQVELRDRATPSGWTSAIAKNVTLTRFKIPRGNIAWVGGSIAGSLDGFHKACITYDTLMKDQTVLNEIPSTTDYLIGSSIEVDSENEENAATEKGAEVIRTVVAPPANPFLDLGQS